VGREADGLGSFCRIRDGDCDLRRAGPDGREQRRRNLHANRLRADWREAGQDEWHGAHQGLRIAARGAKAIYNSSGTLAYFRHSHWLGSSRLTSTATPPTSMYSSTAYAPFGESQAGQTSGAADASFTGQDQDTVSSLYDFPARRYSPSQGRWISPDPAGRGAVILTNPQSWNRYAYVMNNPLALTDPAGLSARRHHRPHSNLLGACPIFGDDDDDGCGGGGGGGDDDDDDDDDNSGNPPDDPPCDFDCQLQQAEQNALNALSNPDCAQAVDGGTGFAATALVQAMSGGDPSSPLYGSTASGVTMQGGDLGANIVTPNGFSGTGAKTSPTFSYDTNDNGQLVNTGVNGAVITVNSNPNGEFLNPIRIRGSRLGIAPDNFRRWISCTNWGTLLITMATRLRF
jgi:RHS repeat-associated protein